MDGNSDGVGICWADNTQQSNPYPTDTVIVRFLTEFDSSAVRAFGRIENDLRSRYAITALDSALLQGYEKTFNICMNTLLELDSLLKDTTLSHSDYLKTLSEGQETMDCLATALYGYNAHLDSLPGLRLMGRSILMDSIDLLPDTAIYQANNKKVLELLFLNFLGYTVSLDSMERVALTDIAEQCPLAGGEAVLIARTMLDVVNKTPVFYNDALLCEQEELEERSHPQRPGSTAVCSVSPNPASGILTLRYELPAGSTKGIFILRNSLGKPVSECALNASGNIEQVSLQNLPNGIYTWECRDNKTIVATGKVVVLH